MKKIPNFCSECKTEVKDLDNLLFVEQSTTKGFCSEKCIMDFYTPHMEFFSNLELQFREVINLDEFQDYTEYYVDAKMMTAVTDAPDEALELINDIDVSYHLHVKYFAELDIYYLIICSHYDDNPSFIYNKLITKSQKLVEMYREFFKTDELAPAESGEGKLESLKLPDEVLDELQLKKSEHLAMLLERRKDSDIPFETFPIYDDYLSLSLEDPDQVFHFEDEAGDEISNYIKSFKKSGKEFYYVVSCLKVSIKEEKTTKIALLPIISFPSIDKDLYQHYAVGESKTDRLKN